MEGCTNVKIAPLVLQGADGRILIVDSHAAKSGELVRVRSTSSSQQKQGKFHVAASVMQLHARDMSQGDDKENTAPYVWLKTLATTALADVKTDRANKFEKEMAKEECVVCQFTGNICELRKT